MRLKWKRRKRNVLQRSETSTFLLKSVKTAAHTTEAIVFAWLKVSRGAEKTHNRCSRRTTAMFSSLSCSSRCHVACLISWRPPTLKLSSGPAVWAKASWHEPRGMAKTGQREVHLIFFPCWRHEAPRVKDPKSIVPLAFLQECGYNGDNEWLLRPRQAWNFPQTLLVPGE